MLTGFSSSWLFDALQGRYGVVRLIILLDEPLAEPEPGAIQYLNVGERCHELETLLSSLNEKVS
jgi:hypothetical protein